jgi:CRISPR-associated endonuclease/helicase Cas3
MRGCIAADVAGSALPRNGRDAVWWAEEVLSRRCFPTDYEQAAASGAKGGNYRPFQIAVSESTARVTFVRAGCGSGKTTAAYLWASRRTKCSRLYVCYPTTGTATEGFRDYIADNIPLPLSALLHGRSEVDLEIFFETNEDDSIASLQRINALESWDAPMVVCTVDRVLGIIQNSRLPLFGTPTLMNAAFVFDEIHLYDERLFGALLHFLQIFRGAPVLLMTASLSAARLEAIRRVLAAQGEELCTIAGDSRLESLERYRFRGLVDDPIDAIRETIALGGKVLWVSNTVRQCIRAFAKLLAGGMNPIPYHSRYRYIDRLKRHSAVIEAFRSTGPALAVTTQVCEISLDLSADLLVTEIAPIPALIQRLGRLNRRASPDRPTDLREAVFLRPPYPMPYEQDELALASKWMNSLIGKPLSQRDLAESFEALCCDSPPVPVNCAWLDGGLLSSQAPLRDAGTTIPVVRGEDRNQCLENGGRIARTEVLKNTIPMPLGPVAKEIPNWTRAANALISPVGRISYDPLMGATWTKGAD